MQNSLGDDFNTTQGRILTIDERVYQIALRKKKMSDTILEAVRESAIDCAIHNADDTLCILQNVKSENKYDLINTDERVQGIVNYNGKIYYTFDHDKTYLYDQNGVLKLRLKSDGKYHATV